jgi:hypothetical protein
MRFFAGFRMTVWIIGTLSNADETLKNLISLKDEGIYKRKNKNFEREKS